MTTAALIAMGSAIWLGLLTAISPCPLATNIAAIAFVSREIKSPRRALGAAMLYTLGRSLAYVALAGVAVFATTRLLAISVFLQGTLYRFLGPFLIVVGMVLAGLVELRLTGRGVSEAAQERVRRGGLLRVTGLGAFFALSFCPVSAALFFGGLIPLAVKHSSILAIPGAYGVATGLPVALFAVMIVTGASRVAARFQALSRVEAKARLVTGWIFILVGVYETLRVVFGLF